jgi:hypothetical protein
MTMGEVIAFPRARSVQLPGGTMHKVGRRLKEAVALLDGPEARGHHKADNERRPILGRYERPPANRPLSHSARGEWRQRWHRQMELYRTAVLVLEVEQNQRQEHNARHGRRPWLETPAETAARDVMVKAGLELMRMPAPHMIALAWKRRHRGHFGRQDEVEVLITADETWMATRYANYSRVRSCRPPLPGSAGHG